MSKRTIMAKLFPSLIAADLLNLRQEITQLDPFVDGYHIDVMDFHFVPNLTLGPDTINAIRQATVKPLLIHLMVENPEKYFERLSLKNGDVVSIHPESPSELSLAELILLIASHGWTPSLALNPETHSSIIETIKTPLHHILLMSVQPGFSGQAFMPIVYKKIDEVKAIIPHCTIAVDGGVNLDNAPDLARRGAQELVIGSALFSSPNPLESIKALKYALNSSQKTF